MSMVHIAILLGLIILTACLQLHVNICVGVNMNRFNKLKDIILSPSEVTKCVCHITGLLYTS